LIVNARWAGRNRDKDGLRAEIWNKLEDSGSAIGEAQSKIPNFVGAELAANRLAELDIWKTSRVVKCNPDRGQAPVRLRALQDGKILYAPVPELVADFPFVKLDPDDLVRRGIQFSDVQYSEDFVHLGAPTQFWDMAKIDLVVVGCVAVTRIGGRTGKGGGFADLELGIFCETEKVDRNTPVVTTVHDMQVVDDDRILMMDHDYPLDWILTPKEIIKTSTKYNRPNGVFWDAVQPDQFEGIPFLRSLRKQIVDGKP